MKRERVARAAGIFAALWVGPALWLALGSYPIVTSNPSASGVALTPTSLSTGDAGFNNILVGGTADNVTGLKSDSLQTHTGGAQAMSIATTGSGALNLGNATSGTFNQNGGVATESGFLQVNGVSTLAAGSTNSLQITGASSGNPVSIAAQGTNAGMSFTGTGTGAFSLNATGGTGATTIGNGTGTVTLTAPVNLGGVVTGTWTPFAPGLLTAATNYGALQLSQSVANLKFRNVTCSHRVAGTSTAGTLAIRNVTDSTSLCSGSYTCTTTANTPTLIFDCNQTPLTGKAYAINFTTGCGGTQVTDMGCSVEIAR